MGRPETTILPGDGIHQEERKERAGNREGNIVQKEKTLEPARPLARTKRKRWQTKNKSKCDYSANCK
jgi:hypothetical protein